MPGFSTSGLPLPDDGADASHPKVAELRDLITWSEGMVWCSPERHGAMTGIMKAQIDWIPLSLGAVRPTQGKTMASSCRSPAAHRVLTPSTSCVSSPLDALPDRPQPVINPQGVSAV